MKTYLIKPGIRQTIAKAGETDVAVMFDGRAWATEYPAGHPQLMVTTPGGRQVPVTVEDNAGMIEGRVPDDLLSAPGLYVYQFVWTQGSTQQASNRCDVIITGSELSTTWETRRHTPEWAEKIFLAAEVIEGAMDGTLEARNAAQDAADDAAASKEAAEDSAEAAAASAESAAEDAEAVADKLDEVNAAGAEQLAAIQLKGETTLASIPEDYTALDNEVDDLKSALKDAKADLVNFGTIDASETDVTVNTTTGYAVYNKESYANNGNTTASTNAGYCVLAVSLGERYLITTRAGGNYSAVAFFDSSTISKDHYIGAPEYESSYTTIVDMLVTVPDGASYMTINTLNYSEYPIGVKKIISNKSVNSLYEAGFAYQKSIDEILANNSKFEICMKRGDANVQAGKYMDGRQEKSGAESYCLTDYFEMKTGDVFLLNFVYKITLYDTSKAYSSEVTVSTLANYSGSTRWNTWTATANGYVRFSINNTTSPNWGAAIKLLSDAPYTIVSLGDSLFGNNQKPYDLTTYIQNATGMKSANCGFGGTRASETTAAQYQPLCFTGIADAIHDTSTDPTHAWDDIDINWASLYGDNVFMVNKDILVNIDWSKVQVITVAYGTNDMNGAVTLDNDQNKLDKTTFKGGLRYGIEKILSAYPQITIVLLAPLYRYRAVGAGSTPPDYSEIDYDSDTGNDGGWLMKPYVDAMQEVAEEYHLPFFDNYNSVGLNKLTAPSWLRDGTHLNYTIGPLKIGTKIGEEVASVYNANRPRD